MLDMYFKDVCRSVSYNHDITENPKYADFHLHNRFEIYFFISGNVKYFIEKKVYPLKYGDLLVMNSHEIHKPSFQPGPPYERITIHFEPAILQTFNSPGFNLLACFINRPIGEQNKINLGKKQVDEIMKLFYKIEELGGNTADGADILRLSYFLDLLVFINRAFSGAATKQEEPIHVPEKLVPILEYIDKNLENDLSLEALEHHFYLNRFYLSRLFKKVTGSTLHGYILYKRISRAKKLLSEGYNVTQTCMKCGFGDYSNFLRIFKRTVGISPGQYRG